LIRGLTASGCPATAAKDGDCCPAMGADCPATIAEGSGCPATAAKDGDCPAMGANCPATIAEGSGCPATAAKDGDCPAMGADCPATGAEGSGCPAMGADCPATGAEGSGCPATAAKECREFMDCFWGSATKGFQSSVLGRMCGLCKRLKEESSVSSRLCAHRDS
jgi:hypothetical protein